MSGFLALLLLAGLALVIGWLMGLRGHQTTLMAAALAFGAAAYSWAGLPGVPSAPRAARDRPPPPPLTGARHALMGQFDGADRWMTMAESYAARGDTEGAVQLMQSAVRARPGDYAVWVGLGNALTDHLRLISPAARMAYARAAELAPGHPAPLFFEGLALLRSGQPDEAAARWRDVLAMAPRDATWRPLVEEGLATADAVRQAPRTAR